jgi:hypothetical protein
MAIEAEEEVQLTLTSEALDGLIVAATFLVYPLERFVLYTPELVPPDVVASSILETHRGKTFT